MFDFSMIKAVYERFPARIDAARKAVGRPLTLTEKILYAHLWQGDATTAYDRGKSYVDFAPDRVAMQDATAQMALLQFMQAGRAKVAVPVLYTATTLLWLKTIAKLTWKERLMKAARYMIFWLRYPINMV